MKNKVMPTVILVSICVLVAITLSVINMITAPIIAGANEAKVQATLSKVLPTGKNFVPISNEKLSDEVINAYSEENGGYVFQIEVTGYKPGLTVMCGITESGSVSGAEVINSKETLSAEKVLGQKYIGTNANTVKTEIVSGATLTSKAYFEAIDLALKSYDILTKEDSKFETKI